MQFQKQLFRHRPDDGLYGDCFRTAIACVLDLQPDEVPHFAHGLGPKSEEMWDRAQAWLRERDLWLIAIVYPGELDLGEVLMTIKNTNPGLLYLLCGKSANGVNHSVVCFEDEIIHDPSQDDSGIVAPTGEGYWVVEFFGSARALKS